MRRSKLQQPFFGAKASCIRHLRCHALLFLQMFRAAGQKNTAETSRSHNEEELTSAVGPAAPQRPPSTPNPSPKGCRECDKGFAGTLEPCGVRRKRVAETRSKQALLFLVVTLTSMEPSHTTSGMRADAPAGGTSLHRSPGA